MADATSTMENELLLLKEEYKKLQDHLSDIELKYQSALAAINKDDERGDNSYITKLQKVIADFFDKQLYSDIVIILEGGRHIFGHKLILSARSDDWGVDDLQLEDQFDLSDVQYQVGYSMMKWVYTDQIDFIMDDGFLIELLITASKFKLDSLKVRCEKNMISCININNCNQFYKISTECKCVLLRDFCVEYMAQYQIANLNVKIEIPDDYTLSSSSTDDTYTFLKPEKNRNLDKKVGKKSKCGNTSLNDKLLANIVGPFCGVCGMESKDKKALKIHMNSQHLENNSNSESDSATHVKYKSYRCDICGKLVRHLKRHLKNHELKPYSCEFCNKTFSRNSCYEKHQSKCGENTQRCEVCGKSFTRFLFFMKHQATCGEQKYKCDVCGKVFKLKSSLSRHSTLHTVKPYMCDICGKRINDLSHLRSHMTIHSDITPYECDICGKTFKIKSVFNKHKTIHTGERPYVCDLCGKTFRDSSNMKAHARIHSGSKPYKCDDCGKAFRQQHHLKTHHVLIHSSEKRIMFWKE